MSLTKYRQKRSFTQTAEPTGGKAEAGKLRFVIQKHAASHLHYDFRLEMEGVLKSWAVPKGPSTDPEVKRLAMMVEDHPYDYRNFEGIIPAGQYGGGTVIVWDEGTYEPMEFDGEGKAAQDKELRRQLHAGKLKIILKGKKLKGAYALVKAYGRGENGWLLMKLDDKYASTADITLKDKSVISGKNLEQVKATSTNIYGQKPKREATKKKAAAPAKVKGINAKAMTAKKLPAKVTKLLNTAQDKKFTLSLSPMLATLVDKPFDAPGWSYEVKWDGYRTLAFLHEGEVELKSRNNKSFNEKFYAIYDVLKMWKINAVLDGGIVVLNDKGVSNFGALQNWRSEADGALVFYLFDILWLNGKDLTVLPLEKRRELLQAIMLKGNDAIRRSETFEAPGIEFYEAALNMGLEGIRLRKMAACTKLASGQETG